MAALEVMVSATTGYTGLARPHATWAVVAVEALLGVPCMLSLEYLRISDLIWGTTGQPLSSILALLAVGWSLDRSQALEEAGLAGSGRLGRLWLVWIRWLVPGGILVALVSGWLDS